ncbi:FAD dependent oxidoreductase-like protein [Lentithecium fluviatile CBS 122367]|uniref:FAD dependent oxidoreductase-like protein n=1 Tax=Lentithecium fluviatile CBS 122367 TaxID=1168545 RepID=A0A6G1JDC6_9PLEO|nr:FAD dependent oxidoreductase-like protein [Lentithecium fluviatile CBS 122367]
MEARARIPVGPPVHNPLPSYWHNPKSPLSAVIEPETSNPTKPYDYAIIGSGISGAMIAYNLLNTQPGARIVMLEAREICGGATGRNGGHTKAASYRTYLQHKEELGEEEALKIARLEYANIVETHRLARELGIQCENEMCNTVDLIYDQETFEKGKAAIEELRADATDEEKEWGKMAWYRVYEKDDGIKQKFWCADTNTNPTVIQEEKLVGAFEYVAGRIHAYRFTTGILKACVQKGLQLCNNTPVHSILPTVSTASPATSPSPNKPLFDIFTQYATIPTHTIILATNGYTPYLLPSLQSFIVPLRGQITAQQPPKTSKHPSVLTHTYSFIYASGYEYMVPRQLPDGAQHIIIGGGLGRLPQGGAGEFGTVDDSALNKNISMYLRGTVSGYFGTPSPGESAAEQPAYETIAEWTGIMGATADGRPFVGEVPGRKGVWVSVGFNGHGMVLCLKAAEALVEMMTGKSERERWFPESFLIGPERLEKCEFHGRTDMQVQETGEGLVGGAEK